VTFKYCIYICHMKETKIQILQSAITVWGKNLASTLDDIAKHTGISRRTLHRHYSGRDELMDSVFNYIIDEYLINLKYIIKNSSSEKEKLKAFLQFDINSSKKYLVFCQLRKAEFQHIELENENFKEVYSIYHGLFKKLQDDRVISKDLSLQWIETFYLSIVESSDKIIDSGVDLDECFDMAWFSLWNGIKTENQ